MILVEHRGFPYVHLNLFFRTGPVFDPPGLEGLASLTNRALIRGTQAMGRAELEEAVESLGTELVTSTQPHAVSLGGAVLTRHLPRFISLLGEVLTTPTFPDEEVAKVTREMAAEVEAAKDDDGTLVRMWFRRLLFAGHPLGHGASGNKKSLARLTPALVRAHYERFYNHANLLTAASGDVSRADLTALLTEHLGALPRGVPTTWGFPPVPTFTGRKVVLVDKADRSQVQLLVGHPSLDARDPDLDALGLAITAFGGYFTARLMQEVRVKRGLSYGAYARLSADHLGGSFAMSAAPRTEEAVDTLALLFAEYERFVEEGLTDDEIEFARGFIVNAFPFGMETAAQRAAQQIRSKLLDRPDDYVDTYVARIKALSPDAVRDAVRRRLTPKDLLTVVVCTAADLEKGVAALPGVSDVSVVPFADEEVFGD